MYNEDRYINNASVGTDDKQIFAIKLSSSCNKSVSVDCALLNFSGASERRQARG